MRTVCLSLLLLLAGCASHSPPATPPAVQVGEIAATNALKMVGRPYRYGGARPETGFDCSGLVHFSYALAGTRVPQNTEQQRLASRPIRASELRRGDLVFFDHEGRKNSHVGIYLGDGAFVHAPSTGKTVRTDRIDSAYWKPRLSDTRRFETGL